MPRLASKRLCPSMLNVVDFGAMVPVVHWIDSSHKKLVFLANRVSEFLDNTTADQFSEIISNPNDLGEKGLK